MWDEGREHKLIPEVPPSSWTPTVRESKGTEATGASLLGSPKGPVQNMCFCSAPSLGNFGKSLVTESYPKKGLSKKTRKYKKDNDISHGGREKSRRTPVPNLETLMQTTLFCVATDKDSHPMRP